MRVHVVALLLMVAGTVQAQDRCAHATRNALIGGAVGGTLMVGMTVSVPPSHEPRSERRVTSTRALMVTWAGAWGAGLGAAIASGGTRCFPRPVAQRDVNGRCGSAIRTAALRSAVGGGLAAFMLSPILALPLMVPLSPGAGPRVNLDHVMGLFTVGGVVAGSSVGAIKAANECHRS